MSCSALSNQLMIKLASSDPTADGVTASHFGVFVSSGSLG